MRQLLVKSKYVAIWCYLILSDVSDAICCSLLRFSRTLLRHIERDATAAMRTNAPSTHQASRDQASIPRYAVSSLSTIIQSQRTSVFVISRAEARSKAILASSTVTRDEPETLIAYVYQRSLSTVLINGAYQRSLSTAELINGVYQRFWIISLWFSVLAHLVVGAPYGNRGKAGKCWTRGRWRRMCMKG